MMKNYIYTRPNFEHGSYEADTVGTCNNLFLKIFSHIFWWKSQRVKVFTFLGEILLADVTSDNLEAGVKALMFSQLSNLPKCPT